MAEETQTQEAGKFPKKRRIGHKKGSKSNKRLKTFQGTGKKNKIDKKMKTLFRKRATEYNSDDDDESAPVTRDENELPFVRKHVFDGKYSNEEGEGHQDSDDDDEISGEENKISEDEDEDGEILPGITKFAEGCKAFKMAFKKITKKNVADDILGPVLSAHKKLVAEKLAEEDAERKVKGETKKEKHLLGEKGHVKPANFLDSNEKFLIGVATKGVVKLFNAVNKAQNAQKGLNPSRSKDAKAIRNRRKEAFFSELGKTSETSTKIHTSRGLAEAGPAWAPLQDGYMLTNSKLKDWDKMADTTVAGDIERMPSDTSSDDD